LRGADRKKPHAHEGGSNRDRPAPSGANPPAKTYASVWMVLRPSRHD
jgi:hypothetical protein